MTPFRLRARLRQRLDAFLGEGVGEGFAPGQEAAFARLDDAVEGAFQLVAAAVVGTWEVAVTDVGRALVDGLEPAEHKQATERMSDALVPLLQPLQGVARPMRKAITDGVKQARESGHLSEATEPPVRVVEGLADQVEEGWIALSAYLEPTFGVVGQPGHQQQFEARASELRGLFDEAAGAYREAMHRLPESDDLEAGLLEALDRYRQTLANGLEHFLYDRRTDLVRAAEERG